MLSTYKGTIYYSTKNTYHKNVVEKEDSAAAC